MRYAFSVFEPYRAAREGRDLRLGAHASATTRSTSRPSRSRASSPSADWMVITGAGPGIMEAGIEGAGAANSFGVSIRLPFEAATTQFLADDPKLVNFRYFFTRKVTFVKEAHGFVLLPGGFGTLDEAFELLTLVQTGKAPPAPIVLLDVPGGTYWLTLDASSSSASCSSRGYISPDDLQLVQHHRRRARRARRVTGFYRNYHSLRFVDGDLVLRMQHAPDRRTSSRAERGVRRHRARAGGSSASTASKAEIADGDVPDLARLRLRFDRRNCARLRELIDRLNAAPRTDYGALKSAATLAVAAQARVRAARDAPSRSRGGPGQPLLSSAARGLVALGRGSRRRS